MVLSVCLSVSILVHSCSASVYICNQRYSRVYFRLCCIVCTFTILVMLSFATCTVCIPLQGIPTESVSMDTTSHHGNASTAVSTAGGIGLNGMNSTCSSSSPSEVNCSTKNTNVDEWKKQHEIYEDDTPVGKEEEPKLDCAPGGNTVVIPQLRAAIDAHRGQ